MSAHTAIDQGTLTEFAPAKRAAISRRKFLQGIGVAGAALPATTLFAQSDNRLSRASTETSSTWAASMLVSSW